MPPLSILFNQLAVTAQKISVINELTFQMLI